VDLDRINIVVDLRARDAREEAEVVVVVVAAADSPARRTLFDADGAGEDGAPRNLMMETGE
jgi:hypothetical protein